MPTWLANQLRRAYATKNMKMIRMLNESWFFYGVRDWVTTETESTAIPTPTKNASRKP